MTTKSSPKVTITKVQSHLPNIYLIERNQLLEDYKNRVKIHKYEVTEAMTDFKNVIKKLGEIIPS